jgi:hypothetical protein
MTTIPLPHPQADRRLAARLDDLAARCGFSPASRHRKVHRFLAGRREHGDDLAALDLVGEAREI